MGQKSTDRFPQNDQRRDACGVDNRSVEKVLYPRESRLVGQNSERLYPRESRLVGQSSERLGASMGGLLRDRRRVEGGGEGLVRGSCGDGGSDGGGRKDVGAAVARGAVESLTVGDAAEPLTVGDEWKEARTAEGRM